MISRKRRPARRFNVCLEPLELRFLLSASAPVGIAALPSDPTHNPVLFPFSYNRPGPYQPDSSDGIASPADQSTSTPADPATDGAPGSAAGGNASSGDSVPQIPLAFTGNSGGGNSSGGSSGDSHHAPLPDGSGSATSDTGLAPPGQPNAVTSPDAASVSSSVSGSSASISSSAPLAASTVVSRPEAATAGSRTDSVNGAASAFARSLTQPSDTNGNAGDRALDLRSAVAGVDFSRYQLSLVMSGVDSGPGASQIGGFGGYQKLHGASSNTDSGDADTFVATLRRQNAASGMFSESGPRRHNSVWTVSATESSSQFVPFAHWVRTAEAGNRNSTPEGAASLRNYLQVDWVGLESRMIDFLQELEEFGASANSRRGSQPGAASIWISLVAVATLAVEWARRQNRIELLPGNVAGIRSDRRSSHRA